MIGSPVFRVGAGWAVGWDGAGKLQWAWEIVLGVGGDRGAGIALHRRFERYASS